jgi:hypothetical protein
VVVGGSLRWPIMQFGNSGVDQEYVVWEGTSPGSCAYYFKLISNSSVGNWNIRFEVIIFLP